jgi:hypothetical protein
VENDPCTVGTTRNYTAGTGNRQNTSAQVKERNRHKETPLWQIATEKCNMAHFLLVTKSSPPSGGLTKM